MQLPLAISSSHGMFYCAKHPATSLVMSWGLSLRSNATSWEECVYPLCCRSLVRLAFLPVLTDTRRPGERVEYHLSRGCWHAERNSSVVIAPDGARLAQGGGKFLRGDVYRGSWSAISGHQSSVRSPGFFGVHHFFFEPARPGFLAGYGVDFDVPVSIRCLYRTKKRGQKGSALLEYLSNAASGLYHENNILRAHPVDVGFEILLRPPTNGEKKRGLPPFRDFRAPWKLDAH